MTTVQCTPSDVAANATACAWLPADAATRPACFWASVRWSTLLSAPRGLNEPVRWKFSSFRYVRVPPQMSPSVREVTSGVRWILPARRRRAVTTSACVITGSGISPAGSGAAMGERRFAASGVVEGITLVGRDGPASRETGVDVVPVADLGLARAPAEQHRTAVAEAVEVDEAFVEALEVTA